MFFSVFWHAHSLTLPPSRASLVGDTICLIAYFQPRWQILAQKKGAAALSDFSQLRVVFSFSFFFGLSSCRRFNDCFIIVLSAALLFKPCILSFTFLWLSPPLALRSCSAAPTICAQTNSGRGDGRRAVAVVGVWGRGCKKGQRKEEWRVKGRPCGGWKKTLSQIFHLGRWAERLAGRSGLGSACSFQTVTAWRWCPLPEIAQWAHAS